MVGSPEESVKARSVRRMSDMVGSYEESVKTRSVRRTIRLMGVGFTQGVDFANMVK